MESHVVKYMDLHIEVVGNYYRGSSGTLEQPPERAEFEIDKVLIQGINITTLVENDMNDIEQIVLSKFYS